MRRLAITALMLAACGGDDVHHLGDAPPAPDGNDAHDAGEQLVSVTVTDRGVPAVGATVYFQNPSSSLVRATTTDIDGIARAPVAEGGFVTVIEPRPSAIGVVVIRDRLSTFAGVKPGDELHLDLAPLRSTTSVDLEVTVPDDPGAESYDLYTSCGRAQLTTSATTTPFPVTLTGCGGIADMLVVSVDIGGRPLRSLYRAAQPVSNGATIAFTEAYVDVVPVALSITGTPAWVRNYVVELVVASGRGRLFSGFASAEAAVPAATVALPVAAGTSVAMRLDIFPEQPAVARQTILAWGVPVADSTVNAGTAVLRPISSRPAFDPATRTVTWTDEPGKTPDVVRAELYTYRDGDPAHAWTWQIVAPYGDHPALTLPVLQGDAAAAFTTLATDSFTVADLETLAIDGGYDRIRPHALRQALDVPPPGAAGQLTYQRLYDENLLGRPTLRPPATFTRATR